MLSNAQSRGFNYKAIITDNGSVLVNQPVDIRFTILKYVTTSVYSESVACNTDNNGMVTEIIGNGDVISGDFDSINWQDGSYSLKVEIYIDNTWHDFGSYELQSVPYAKFAQKADSVDYSHVSNAPVTFYMSGTTNQVPSDINDTIYHTGNLYLGGNFNGDDTHEAKLFVQKSFTDGTETADISTEISSNNNLTYYGLNTSIFPRPDGIYYGHLISLRGGNSELFGLSTYIYSDEDGNHYGTQNKLYGNGAGDKYSTYNDIGSTGDGKNYGTYSLLSGDGNGQHYSSYSELSGAGTGMHYGNYSLLTGDGTGEQYASYNMVTNSKDADHYGTYNTMGGEGAGSHYGTYNKNWGSGTGYRYGVYNEFALETGDITQYGVYNDFHTTGQAYSIGTYNNLRAGSHQIGSVNYLLGTGAGIQECISNVIYTENDNDQYGMVTLIRNKGNGKHIITDNSLSGEGNGDQIAVNNIIDNTGSGTHYGMNNILYGNGTGTLYGINNYIAGTHGKSIYGLHNSISNTSNYYHYGVYNEISNGGAAMYGTYNHIKNGAFQMYGTYTLIEGSNTYDKVGTFVKITSSSGGRHYGIYAEVLKEGSYAGYFNGDVVVTKKLKSSTSGDSDMKAYVYGFVLYDGTLKTDRSSEGFTVTKESTGVYKITLTGVSTSDDHFVANASAEFSNNPAIVNVDYADYGGSTEANAFYVRAFNLSGNPIECSFHFIVYKK